MLIAMVSSVLLITDYLLTLWPAVILTAVAAGWFLTFWVFVPWFRHNWIDEDLEDEDEVSSSGRVHPDTPDGVVNGDDRPVAAPSP
jgi:hypothetical protein